MILNPGDRKDAKYSATLLQFDNDVFHRLAKEASIRDWAGSSGEAALFLLALMMDGCVVCVGRG